MAPNTYQSISNALKSDSICNVLSHEKGYDTLANKISLFLKDARRQTSLKLTWLQDNNEFNQVIADIVNLAKIHSDLSIDELDIVFEYGIIGEFGEYYGINKKTINQWIKAYKNGIRKEAKAHVNSQKIKEETKSTSYEKQLETYLHLRKQFVDLYRTFRLEYLSAPGSFDLKNIPEKVEFTGMFWNIWYNRFTKAKALMPIPDDSPKNQRTAFRMYLLNTIKAGTEDMNDHLLSIKL
ncbi:hypothetical protein AUTU_49340 (plasmid) [Aureibacter tunicatorum]|nr:hypothetical protein AUTU_49340 [Aureibacter tunicatorum]